MSAFFSRLRVKMNSIDSLHDLFSDALELAHPLRFEATRKFDVVKFGVDGNELLATRHVSVHLRHGARLRFEVERSRPEVEKPKLSLTHCSRSIYHSQVNSIPKKI